MEITELLADFGVRHTGESLELDKTGVCCMSFGDKHTVCVEPITNSDVTWIYGPVGPVPAIDREAVFSMLLQAHLFGAETSGFSFAVDPKSDEILMTTSIRSASLDADTFDQLLQDFMATISHWSRRLVDGAPVGQQEHPLFEDEATGTAMRV